MCEEIVKFIRYEVQVGRGKSKYEIKYTTTNQSQANFLYRCLNIGYGYKKRLVAVYEDHRNVLARYIS